jgi:hypothetical protein
MGKTLDELLHGPSALPVLVKADGTFETAAYPPATLAEYAPESIDVDYEGSFEDGQILDHHERDAIGSLENGWTVLTGWSADPSLFIMRNDQYIGGALAEHIAGTPGLWAIVSVEMNPHPCGAGKDGMPCPEWDEHETCEHAEGGESDGVGWALVHREPQSDNA